MNPTQFAALLGVTAGAVDRWEDGERHPRWETMERLNNLAKEQGINLSDPDQPEPEKQPA